MKADLLPDRKLFSLALCPKCGSGKVKVLQTQRPKRKLLCKVCGYRYSTIEVVVQPDVVEKAVLANLLVDGHINTREMLSLVHLF